MTKNFCKKLVTAALLAALTCVATALVRVPSPAKGYLNLGDCVVLVTGWALSPVYGFLASGLGSAMADVFSGYAVYAPATFVIKGLMAMVVSFVVRKKLPLGLLACAAEILMVLGYFGFEGFLYGLETAAVNIPANAVQGTAGLTLGCAAVKVLKKNRIS